MAVQEVRDIFALLEADFSPLELCQRLAPLLDKLPGLTTALSPAAPVEAADLGAYSAALKRCAIIKTLNQLSQVRLVCAAPAPGLGLAPQGAPAGLPHERS